MESIVMFTSKMTVQLPRGTMLLYITCKCRQLDENDLICPFSITDVIRDWFLSDDADQYRGTPELLVLGIWIMLTEILKEDQTAAQRDFVFSSIELEAPGQTISFDI
mgnify:CR=1 FL=1